MTTNTINLMPFIIDQPGAPAAGKPPTKIIYCQRSGVILAEVKSLCSNGWPFLSASALDKFVHPLYSFSLDRLIMKFKGQLHAAEQSAWTLTDREIKEISIVMSAIMYSLEAMWQPSPEAVYKIEHSLPCEAIIVGCGSRLLHLAGWYHFATSKRMELPYYRASQLNNNLDWSNFRTWLDDAYSVKKEWEAGRTVLEQEDLLKKRTSALLTIRAENVYKRIDLNKVWRWIEIQLVQDGRYPAGRRETFQTIFMKGDMHPEDWIQDDLEDLQFALTECCDIGNEISHFINVRLESIKRMINDFYSGFTLLSSSVADMSSDTSVTELEKEKTGEFFQAFDGKAEAIANGELEALPEPKREHFGSLGLFLKAKAEANILNKRVQMFINKKAS